MFRSTKLDARTNARRGTTGLAALAAAAVLSAPALAQVEPPDPALRSLGRAAQVIIPQARTIRLTPATNGGIEIERVQARVVLDEGKARTTLDIALRNTSRAIEEAVLLIPVPDGAVVSAFDFAGQAAEPTATVLARDEARRLYDAIVAKVRDPALLEFAGYRLIRSSVFPVEPLGTQRLVVTWEHLPTADGQRIDYVLPRSESLATRLPWQVQVDITSRVPVSTVYSPSHELITERLGPGRVSVRLAERATLEPGSFHLSYLLERDGVSASVFAYPDPEIGGGYFLLMAGLPAEIDEDAMTLKREVTVVIDTSGSMAGPKMDQVRAAATQVLEGLADGEAFNIIDYATTVSSFAAAPVVKNEQVMREARQYLKAMRPGGGTNIHDALVEAMRQPPMFSKTEGLPIVLFLTDGLPTIGRTRETEIRRLVERSNEHGRRIFTFGVGQDVNVPLLDRVADISRATSTYVLAGENVEVKVAGVFRRLAGPVFAEPALTTVDASGVATTRRVREVIPGRLPDLFAGDQLIVLGEYRGDEPVTLRLQGTFLGAERTFSHRFDPAAATTRNAFVPRLWASRRIAQLIDQVRQAGAASTELPSVVGTSPLDTPGLEELIEEILRLSTKFGILTEYTSFLATEGTDLSNWNDLKVGCRTELDERAVKTRSGAGALNQSLNYRRQTDQKWLNRSNKFVDAGLREVEFAAVQQLCDRAFFRRGNRWIDSRLVSVHELLEPDRVVVLGSAAHTVLLDRLARAGRAGVLSLAGEILLEVDGEIVLVQDGC